MNVKLTYTWVDGFARIPDTSSGRANGKTHGVCVTTDGYLIVFHQAKDALLTFDVNGKLVSAVGGDRWQGAHGLTLIQENGAEFLWLTDQFSAEVVKVNLNGETVQSITRAPHAAYDAGGSYSPTWAAQNPTNGDIWVADGYGSSLVHRYDREGAYLATLDGTEGAGRFACPHGINFRAAAGGPELWITDRANHRVVIYDSEGHFQRATAVTHSPCCFDFRENLVVIPELFTGVKILEAESLNLIVEIGASGYVSEDARPEGWPNLAGTSYVKPGKFNSPHGACFAPNGDIYCVEWIIGGRITRLRLES